MHSREKKINQIERKEIKKAENDRADDSKSDNEAEKSKERKGDYLFHSFSFNKYMIFFKFKKTEIDDNKKDLSEKGLLKVIQILLFRCDCYEIVITYFFRN
jgi:hypothetical protein